MSQSLEQTKVAKRYVNALFSSLSKDSEIKAVSKDMSDLEAMIASSTDLQDFISSPLLNADSQKVGVEAFAKKAKLSKAVTNLLLLLVENRRLSLLPVIARETQAYLAKQSGTIPVMIATARELSSTDQKKIGADIKKAIGQDIAMQAYVDETLIGGVVVQVESTLIDGSIKTKLDKLERELTNKAA